MKLIKQIISLALVIYPLFIFAQTAYTIPFYNIIVQPDNSLFADYHFDPNHQIVVCTSSSLASPALHWNYQGIEYGAVLPAGGHLSLKGHPYPEGYFADTQGIITIYHNNPNNKSTLMVSCEYHTWG